MSEKFIRFVANLILKFSENEAMSFLLSKFEQTKTDRLCKISVCC